MSKEIREQIDRVMNWKPFLNENHNTQFPISYEKFIEISEMEVDDNSKNFYNQMTLLFNNLPNPLPIYRLIFVDDTDDVNLKELGTSWTWDRKNWDDLISSVLYDDDVENGDITVLISGYIDKMYVNWEDTVNKYLTQHLYSKDFDENEIVIPKSSYSKIKNLKWSEYDN